METTCLVLPTQQARLRGPDRALRKSEAVLHSNDREAAVLAGRLIAAQESAQHAARSEYTSIHAISSSAPSFFFAVDSRASTRHP